MLPTRYVVEHRTDYTYSVPVAIAHGVAHLRPRTTVAQSVLTSVTRIDPTVDHRAEYLDAFGNFVEYWSIEHAHQALSVTCRSQVEVWPAVVPVTSPAWDSVAALLHDEAGIDATEAGMCCVESPLVAPTAALADYARSSFPAGRPIFAAIADLTGRIHRDFEFAPGATDVTTPLDEVLTTRRGVCQDLAHVAIGCLRSLGLPARYVSGYIETDPPEGRARLIGADASHAWFAAYIPGWGWLDADPTNDLTPPDRHITVAWGRDYGDVAPIHGVVFGPPGEQSLSVSVDVQRQLPAGS